MTLAAVVSTPLKSCTLFATALVNRLSEAAGNLGNNRYMGLVSMSR